MSSPYPAPYPPPYQPVPRPAATSTTGPKVLTFIGIAVLVLSIGIGVGGGLLLASGVHSLDANIREIDSKVDAAAIATIQPGQTETVTLGSRTSYTLWLGADYRVPDAGPDGSASSSTRPVVTDPTGTSLTVSTSTYSNLSGGTDESLEGWRFTSRDAGVYEITAAADGPTLQLMPGVEVDVLIDGATGAARAVGGGLLVATGTGLGTIGVGLLIGGAVWWSVRSKNARRAAQTGHPVG